MNRAGANLDIEATLRYHATTNHSEAKLSRDSHVLDWNNQPRPFKIYCDVESVPLPSDPTLLVGASPPLLDVIATAPADVEGSAERIPDLEVLARTLYLAAGIIKRKRYPGGGEMLFRAYPNTGALYHIDLYLVTGDLPGLPAGVYHFGPDDFALHRLRAGDYRAVLAEASGMEARVARAPAILVSASTYWRNAWKYQARAYRHCFWDAGTLHANLLAAADAELLQPRVVLGFADEDVAALLGLDTGREAPLTLVPLGCTETPIPPAPPMPTLALETEALSRSEIDYPAIREMQQASSLADSAAVAAWRSPMALSPSAPSAKEAGESLRPLQSMDEGTLRSLSDVIRKRGSTRAFDRTRAITFPALCAVLDRATRGVAADVLAPGSTLLDLYLIVHAVEGLAPGAYYYRREEGALERLREGDFRATAGRLDLGQALAADAAVNVYSLCSLPVVLERFGNRGYRAAQLEGGITGGRMYLAAYAQGFGATGLTFFDDEVTQFFSPHAAGKSVMFLVALGYPDRVALGLERPG
ncbi:MAG: SagB/ThcOx family dehydrogenase [Gammaproteobacteria bacterium]|nr:SagB/ThcOx family dehydrogenase [Gammaproteobacteria bacterium]